MEGWGHVEAGKTPGVFCGLEEEAIGGICLSWPVGPWGGGRKGLRMFLFQAPVTLLWGLKSRETLSLLRTWQMVCDR